MCKFCMLEWELTYAAIAKLINGTLDFNELFDSDNHKEIEYESEASTKIILDKNWDS